MGYILSKNTLIPDLYQHYIILYYSSFTLLMQIFVIGLIIALCMKSIRCKILWSTTLGCFLDAVVTTILANIAEFLMLNDSMELFYEVVPMLLLLYTPVRVKVFFHSNEEKQDRSDLNYICKTITVFIHILLWFPLLLIILITFVWLILIVISNCRKIPVWITQSSK